MNTMTDWHLVGDIGGTNARFGLTARGDSAYRDIATYEVANFPEFGLVLDQLMRDIAASGLAQDSPAAICLAIADPPHVETISFTNSSWRFSRDLLRERTGALQIEIINDFTTVARAIPALTGADLEQIGEGHIQTDAPVKALGAGTGVAALVQGPRGESVVITGEGGHVVFAPVTDVEVEIDKRLWARFGHVSIEQLMCGVGIINIYQALADCRRQPAPLMYPGDVGAAAVSGDDPLARDAILLRLSDFRARFLAKGRFADYLPGIPTFVVTHPGIGLLGATIPLTE